MNDLRCFNCLLDPVPNGASGMGAVTLVMGTAYCADHARLFARQEGIVYVDPEED